MVRVNVTDESKLETPAEQKQGSASQSSRWLTPFEEMGHFFANFSAGNWMRPLHMDWPDWSHLSRPFAGKIPHVDIVDKEDEIILRAELPGVEKKDLEVCMTDHTMTIKGTTNYEEKEEKGEYFRAEIAHGEFCRTVLLPVDVDVEGVKSSFKNGLLEVHVPKLEKESRKITIN